MASGEADRGAKLLPMTRHHRSASLTRSAFIFSKPANEGSCRSEWRCSCGQLSLHRSRSNAPDRLLALEAGRSTNHATSDDALESLHCNTHRAFGRQECNAFGEDRAQSTYAGRRAAHPGRTGTVPIASRPADCFGPPRPDRCRDAVRLASPRCGPGAIRGRDV